MSWYRNVISPQKGIPCKSQDSASSFHRLLRDPGFMSLVPFSWNFSAFSTTTLLSGLSQVKGDSLQQFHQVFFFFFFLFFVFFSFFIFFFFFPNMNPPPTSLPTTSLWVSSGSFENHLCFISHLLSALGPSLITCLSPADPQPYWLPGFNFPSPTLRLPFISYNHLSTNVSIHH